MIVDPAVLPGLLLLAAELATLAAVGYVIVRVALRQDDERMALAQGLVVGPALWGVIVNFVLYAVPGLAGAAVGWGLTLALGAGLAWRAPNPIRPRPRVLAGFAVAVLALFWVGLASRQLLSIPDAMNHVGLAASIRAGGFPPAFFWIPDNPAPYHYGAGLLIGLLAPPFGPDLAFSTEVLDVWMWASFVLVVVTALLRRTSRFAVLLTAPLMLTAGAWTFIADPVDIVKVPLPAGIPSAGIRASLTEIYWPHVELPWASEASALPDIWRFVYTLAYALAFVILEHAARVQRRSLPAALTLAGLVGFLALLATTLAPIVLALWAALEAVALVTSWRAGAAIRGTALRSGAGLAAAMLMYGFGGGTFASALSGSVSSGVSIAWSQHPGLFRPLGSVDSLPGGVALLRGGPVVIAGVAAILARRDRLTLILAVGACVLVLAAVALHYHPAPVILGRFVGHARNFALLALVLALGAQLASLRSGKWRYATAAALLALVVWPTVVAPVRNAALTIGQGTTLANAQWPQPWPGGRFALPPMSDRIATYLRVHTPADARVLSPTPTDMSFSTVPLATGRPNASGFVEHIYSQSHTGPFYVDAIRHLEPAAFRRLGLDYVYATEGWAAELPDRAARWLEDPDLFDLLIRDGAEALYRVRPAFLELDVAPAPASFEALHQAVPAETLLYLPAPFRTAGGLRVASALSHARLLGAIDPTMIYLMTPWRAEPLGKHVPDLVILWRHVEPWMFPPAARQPIWWNDEIAVYAPDGAIAPIMAPPPEPEPAPVSIQVSKVQAVDGRIAFTASFHNHDPEQWTGQDWVVLVGDDSPWAIPMHVEPGGRTIGSVAWFPGQAAATQQTSTYAYDFDVASPGLAVRDATGEFAPTAGSSRGKLGEGAWTLAVRLQHEWKPLHWREVGRIPVLRVSVSETGEVTHEVFADARGGRPFP